MLDTNGSITCDRCGRQFAADENAFGYQGKVYHPACRPWPRPLDLDDIMDMRDPDDPPHGGPSYARFAEGDRP